MFAVASMYIYYEQLMKNFFLNAEAVQQAATIAETDSGKKIEAHGNDTSIILSDF